MGSTPAPEREVSTVPPSQGDSPRRSISNVSVRFRSDSSNGVRWGQCVFDPDGDEFDENGAGGGPGGSTSLARGEHEVRSENLSLHKNRTMEVREIHLRKLGGKSREI